MGYIEGATVIVKKDAVSYWEGTTNAVGRLVADPGYSVPVILVAGSYQVTISKEDFDSWVETFNLTQSTELMTALKRS